MNKTVWNEFEEEIKDDPTAAAVSDENRQLTRKELGEMAVSIAKRIPEDTKMVGIIMDHGVEMIASMFAALLKGAAYVPAEPTFPPERINYMMDEAGVSFVITNEKYMGLTRNLPHLFIEKGYETGDIDPAEIEELKGPQEAESLMYVLYTSGTTGKPKGVSVTNKNVCHYAEAFGDEFHPDASDTMLQYSVCSFDIFVEEVFASLLNGAALAIPSEDEKSDMDRLMKFVSDNNVTMMSGFPYLLQDINDLEDIPSSLRLIISGGDVIRGSYVTNLRNKVTVYNTYGPSETTVCASYYNCSDGYVLEDGTFPVGKPVTGTNIRIMDRKGRELPAGQLGEICIFGDGVSNGYIGNRDEENKAFVDLPDGGRMYHSGDLGYLLPDGNIAFVHRMDTQVMILGKRIEVSEVTNVLLQSDLIRQAVVVPKTDDNHLSYMVAYVVKNDPGTSEDEIRSYLSNYLTPFMIPEFFVDVDSIPLNVNGKPDISQLPEISGEVLYESGHSKAAC